MLSGKTWRVLFVSRICFSEDKGKLDEMYKYTHFSLQIVSYRRFL